MSCLREMIRESTKMCFSPKHFLHWLVARVYVSPQKCQLPLLAHGSAPSLEGVTSGSYQNSAMAWWGRGIGRAETGHIKPWKVRLGFVGSPGTAGTRGSLSQQGADNQVRADILVHGYSWVSRAFSRWESDTHS